MTHFSLLALGTGGGPYDGDLAGYLLRPQAGSHALALDAGTLLSGLEIAHQRGHLNAYLPTDESLSRAGDVFRNHVGGYFLSHAHLDHIAGLVINSQADVPKPIFGLGSTLQHMQQHVFNWVIWPNYGNEGTPPCLGVYTYQEMVPGQPIPFHGMTLEIFVLSHPHEYQSSALLVESGGYYFLYLGDTAADSEETEKKLDVLWHRIGPLIREKTIRGILIECSTPQSDSREIHYGHLNTEKLIEELGNLRRIANCSLRGLPLLIIHRKKDLSKAQLAFHRIQHELESSLQEPTWLFPCQGDHLIL